MIHFLITTVALSIFSTIELTPYSKYDVHHNYVHSTPYLIKTFHNHNRHPNIDIHETFPHDSNHHPNIDIRELFLQRDGVDMVCTMYSTYDVHVHKNDVHKDDVHVSVHEANRLLDDYLLHRKSTSASGWVAYNPLISCALLDLTYQYIYLIGDTVGGLPLWYEFKSLEVFISSHMLLGASLGFTQLSPVGAGHTLSVRVTSDSLEIINCQHWSTVDEKEMSVEESSKKSLEMLHATTTSLSTVLIDEQSSHDGSSGGVMSELDMKDDSSVFLECALHNVPSHVYSSMVEPRVRYNTQPLISDYSELPSVLTRPIFGTTFMAMVPHVK